MYNDPFNTNSISKYITNDIFKIFPVEISDTPIKKIFYNNFSIGDVKLNDKINIFLKYKQRELKLDIILDDNYLNNKHIDYTKFDIFYQDIKNMGNILNGKSSVDNWSGTKTSSILECKFNIDNFAPKDMLLHRIIDELQYSIFSKIIEDLNVYSKYNNQLMHLYYNNELIHKFEDSKSIDKFKFIMDYKSTINRPLQFIIIPSKLRIIDNEFFDFLERNYKDIIYISSNSNIENVIIGYAKPNISTNIIEHYGLSLNTVMYYQVNLIYPDLLAFFNYHTI